jgi:hypothetical protein
LSRHSDANPRRTAPHGIISPATGILSHIRSNLELGKSRSASIHRELGNSRWSAVAARRNVGR